MKRGILFLLFFLLPALCLSWDPVQGNRPHTTGDPDGVEATKGKADEEPAVEENGCIQVLRVAKAKEDRYGRRIKVVVKVLKRTGPLSLASERNRKPCFKVCADFFDPDGMPLQGESSFVHESDVEMLPGETGVLYFYLPSEASTYRVWLPGPGDRPKRPQRESPPKKPPASHRAEAEGAIPAPSKGAPRHRSLEALHPVASRGLFALELVADGPIRASRHSFLDAPPRLVLDIPGDWSLPKGAVPRAENEMVVRIRLGSHPDRLRVVLDLTKEGGSSVVTIEETPRGLLLTLKRDTR